MASKPGAGQTALITGASAGIGVDLAECFASGGYDLIITARSEPALQDVAKRIVAGENAVKVYREWRGLTQEALARKVDSAKAYISQIETGAKPGGRAILRKIAGALGVPASVLSED